MRYFLQITAILLLLCPSAIKAQADISVRKKDFKSGKEGFSDAWKHVEEGDSWYSKGRSFYGNAFEEYLQAFVYNNSNAELNYKAGASALFSERKEEAAGFLLKAYELKNDVSEDILLLSGRALQYTGRYEEAIEKLSEYVRGAGKKQTDNIALANKCIEECNSALRLVNDTLNISINLMDESINSGADDYSAIVASDGKSIYFASRREMPKSSDHYADAKFDENIFVSRLTDSLWEPAVPLAKNLTTPYCETPVYINPDNTVIYFYSGYQNGGDIKMTRLNKKGEWKLPEAIPYNINSKNAETAFTISTDSTEIYFITDNGKDNHGGKDIYFIRKIDDRKWSRPQNAGPVVNSEYDEESVRLSVTGDTLWFSSKGHDSMGGFDIFYSVKSSDGTWAGVTNPGYPLNSAWDDLFYFPSPMDKNAFYFVSNRTGGFGGLDIYQGFVRPANESIPDDKLETPGREVTYVNGFSPDADEKAQNIDQQPEEGR